jgi:hypothetical protein
MLPVLRLLRFSMRLMLEKAKANKINSLFKSAQSKGELSVSKLDEIMKKLDEKAEVKSEK